MSVDLNYQLAKHKRYMYNNTSIYYFSIHGLTFYVILLLSAMFLIWLVEWCSSC